MVYDDGGLVAGEEPVGVASVGRGTSTGGTSLGGTSTGGTSTVRVVIGSTATAATSTAAASAARRSSEWRATARVRVSGVARRVIGGRTRAPGALRRGVRIRKMGRRRAVPSVRRITGRVGLIDIVMITVRPFKGLRSDVRLSEMRRKVPVSLIDAGVRGR